MVGKFQEMSALVGMGVFTCIGFNAETQRNFGD
jgi:hypothetical protein